MTAQERLLLLAQGNERYAASSRFTGDISPERRQSTAVQGQRPLAIVVCCSDSRVIPEVLFSCGIGDLFTIQVAGNVLDMHQLGSIEYAAAHLDCPLVVLLGHTRCGAVSAALSGHDSGYIRHITKEIRRAIGGVTDPAEATRLNVLHGVSRLREAFAAHPELGSLTIKGAIYDLCSGRVSWLDG